jgi:hypothetical protein
MVKHGQARVAEHGWRNTVRPRPEPVWLAFVVSIEC